MPFTGFTEEDFAVFELPDFESRMPALKQRITPRLKELGDELVPKLCESYGTTFYPHVAQHLRRSVNPPVATWVAFAKEKRAYKPYVHLRAAITGEDVRCIVFVEDYANEKEAFARNLSATARPLSGYLKVHPHIRAYSIVDKNGEPLSGKALTGVALKGFGDRMARVKGQHAVFGIAWSRDHPVVSSGPQLVDVLVEAAKILEPLYLLGSDKKAALALLK